MELFAIANFALPDMRCFVLPTLFVVTATAALWAQESPPTEPASPLAIRQQRIERMIEELEQKFKQLTLALQATEPRQAERLQQALNRVKELQIQRRMVEVRLALDQTQLDSAASQQQALMTDLQSLLTLLLSEDGGPRAESDESERLAELTRTIEKLLESQRGIKQESDSLAAARAPTAEQTEAIARQQEALTQETGELAEEMTAASEKNQTQPATGGQNVNAAKAAMGAASASLRGKSLASAAAQQQDAIQNLLDAIDEIKDRQKALDAEREAENLATLAAHFRAMLEEQRRLTAQTAALEVKRLEAGGQLSRPDRNVARVIGDLERRLEPLQTAAEMKEPGLAGKAQEALGMLTASGNSVSLPEIVKQMGHDLITVGNLLADDLITGPEVNLLQADIELTLQTLADVLDSATKQQPTGESAAAAGGSKNNQKTRLPASAELQLLHTAQLQINRRTAALDGTRLPSTGNGEAFSKATRDLASRQGQIAEMTARILDGRP